jgi:hypothetical protein
MPVAGPEPLARFAAGTFCQSALDAANRSIVDLRHSLGGRAPPSPAPAASLPRTPAPFVFAARACPPPPWAAAAPARLVVSLGTAPAFPAGTVLPAPPARLRQVQFYNGSGLRGQACPSSASGFLDPPRRPRPSGEVGASWLGPATH